MSITKSVEELLKPRDLIENEWFDCPYPNGTILVQQSHSNGFGPEMWIAGQYTFLESDLDKYPYLTRKLEWWEEREPDEMPEYVKWNYKPNVDNSEMKGLVRKIEGWNQAGYGVITDNGLTTASKHWLPASETEYLNYINTQKNPT
jgi:hypothetical protein